VHKKPGKEARGVWKAIPLAPATGSKLVEDERTKVIIGPFVGFFDLGGRASNESPADIDDLLDEEAALIPGMSSSCANSPASAKPAAVRHRSLAEARSGATIHAAAAQEGNTNAATLTYYGEALG
jgi:hypothetical protein